MRTSFVDIIVVLFGVYFFSDTFCRFGIAGDAKYTRFNLKEHWQIWTTGLVGWVIAAMAIHSIFPQSQAYLQISFAGILGCFPSILLGCVWYVISRRHILKIRFKGAVLLVFGILVGLGIGIFGTIPLLKKQQNEQLNVTLEKVNVGIPLSEATKILGKPSRVLTSVADIEEWGTIRDRKILEKCDLYMFPYWGMPHKYILIYATKDSNEVYAVETMSM